MSHSSKPLHENIQVTSFAWCVHSEPYLNLHSYCAPLTTHSPTSLHPSSIVVASHRRRTINRFVSLPSPSKIETKLSLAYPASLSTLTLWRCLGLELAVADLSVPGRLEAESVEVGLAIRGKRNLEINIANHASLHSHHINSAGQLDFQITIARCCCRTDLLATQLQTEFATELFRSSLGRFLICAASTRCEAISSSHQR